MNALLHDELASPARSRASRAIGALLLSTALLMLAAPITALAAPDPDGPAHANAKRYKPTRAIVVDRQSGRARLPNEQEVADLVDDLARLAQRDEESLQQVVSDSGTVSLDLGGGFGGVMLARPTEDGGWETHCVFTFEEGAEFLGLVAVNSQ